MKDQVAQGEWCCFSTSSSSNSREMSSPRSPGSFRSSHKREMRKRVFRCHHRCKLHQQAGRHKSGKPYGICTQPFRVGRKKPCVITSSTPKTEKLNTIADVMSRRKISLMDRSLYSIKLHKYRGSL